LFTRNGKGLTSKGVKPVCPFQQVFKSTYLSGAFSPITGDHFELEIPFCNTDTFEVFLNEFSKENPNEFKILLLDNGAFHKAKRLIVPGNIHLLFIPPYSPELNPAEKIWWKMKRAFSGKLHKTLEKVSGFIKNQVNALTKQEVKNTCGYDYIFSCPIWTKTY
jgi:transposase